MPLHYSRLTLANDAAQPWVVLLTPCWTMHRAYGVGRVAVCISIGGWRNGPENLNNLSEDNGLGSSVAWIS